VSGGRSLFARSADEPLRGHRNGKIVSARTSHLTGFVEDPAGVEGFGRGGWSVVSAREAAKARPKCCSTRTLRAEAQAVRSAYYEFLAGRWPLRTGDMADRFNACRSTSCRRASKMPDWNNTIVLKGDVWSAVSKLAQELKGEIVVAGSLQLVRTLLAHDLIDELRLNGLPRCAWGRRAPLPRDSRRDVNAPSSTPGPLMTCLSHIRINSGSVSRVPAGSHPQP